MLRHSETLTRLLVKSCLGGTVSPIKKIPVGCKSPLVRHLVWFRRMVFMVFKEGVEELTAVFKFTVDGFDYNIYYNIFLSSDADMRCFKCAKTGHLVRACPERQSDPGVSERPGQDAAESAGVVPPVAAVRGPELLLHQNRKRVSPKPRLQPRSPLELRQPRKSHARPTGCKRATLGSTGPGEAVHD
ncbi:hypothetical protein QTP70_010748 [Hemibagrus guttatus]|uniref:CCHC-type domain-containing protein n=1 Tax=Hemibagrus guttatus TaxID=175788 RepID=A0AAE0PYN7_9TELE|nr:hypothetical protein QTP70_010748 [Hemibagrus guttatus]KAK3527864.1 hypothetical protein QTP86_009733 [Hemibagrus guttatus]